MRLWGKAGGRCQYKGCNKALWYDSLTKSEFNTAYIAHIIADKPDGPRGDRILSERLKKDISNLMILCDEHHRMIDKINVKGHTIERLQKMKSLHEKRIETLTAIQPDKRSHVILYGANIGKINSPLNISNISEAMVNSYGHYPAEPHPIEISLKNSAITDDNSLYWTIEDHNLENHFEKKVKPFLNDNDVSKLSVFALAPQPLLIKLGYLLNDLNSVYTYQKHREPDSWSWQDDQKEIDFQCRFNDIRNGKNIALIISLSANINSERVHPILGERCPIWEITHPNPNNDFLKNRSELSRLRYLFRKTFNDIKTTHGEDATIHVFPAMPVSASIDLGRVWMPKADLSLIIYDQNKQNDSNKKPGFYKAISIR